MKVRLISLFLLILIVGFAPFGNAVVSSFYSDVHGQRIPVGLDHFRYLLSDRALSFSLNITLAWAFSVTLIVIGTALLFASVLNRRNSWSRLFYGILLVPWAIPVYIAVPLWRGLILGCGGDSSLSAFFGSGMNLLTSPPAAVSSTIYVAFWLAVPINSFLLAGAMGKIQTSCIDAARIDGADEGAILRYIRIPRIRGTLLVLAVLTFIKAFKEFSVVFLLTSGGPPLVSGITSRHIIGATSTLGVFLYEIFSETDDFGLSSAFSIIILVFVALFLLFWNYVRKAGRSRKSLALAAAVVQPVFSGWPGLIWALLFVAGYFRKSLFLFTAVVHIVYTVVMITAKGFLRGFQPTVLLSIAVLFLFKAGVKTINYRRRPFLNLLPGISAVLFSLLTAGAVFFLVMVSLGRINALSFAAIGRGGFSLDNYLIISREPGLWRSFLNTLFLSGITALLISFFTFPAAAALAGFTYRRSSSILSGVQIISMSAGIHTLIPLYAMFIVLRMINSYIPLVLIYLYQAVPLALFTTYAYLSELPRSLADQAKLDGIGSFGYIFRILIPLSRPVLITSSMVAFVGAWNGFMAPLLFINDERRYTVSIKLFSLLGPPGTAEPEWNLFAAASIVNMLIITVLFARFRRSPGATALKELDD